MVLVLFYKLLLKNQIKFPVYITQEKAYYGQSLNYLYAGKFDPIAISMSINTFV